MWKSFVLGLCLFAGVGCGNGSEDPDNQDALAYMGIAVGKSWSYDVKVGAATLAGSVKVVKIDTEFAEGVDAYQVEVRQNQLLVATRWYQVSPAGLFLLGEQVQEGTGVVDRTYSTPIKIIPHPLVDDRGIAIQSWTTNSDLVEGGDERHRFDNAGIETLDLTAGSYEAFHLVHTRTDKDSVQHQYDRYFVPQVGFVQFDYPPDDVWVVK